MKLRPSHEALARELTDVFRTPFARWRALLPHAYGRGDGSGRLSIMHNRELRAYTIDPLIGKQPGFFTKAHPCPLWGSNRYQPVCPECNFHANDRDPWIGGHRVTCSRYVRVRECSVTCGGSKCPACKGMIRMS